MKASLNFYFFVGSTYTYLTVQRISELAEQSHVDVTWKPFFLRQILVESGYTPFADKPAKLAYMWRDIERRAAKLRVPYAGEAPYPVDPDGIANRIACLASQEGWCEEYVTTMYRRWFLEHEIPGEPDMLRSVLESLGRNPRDVINLASSQSNVDRLDAETAFAKKLGIFGSPTFEVAGEIFWGDDRLEDALSWASRKSG